MSIEPSELKDLFLKWLEEAEKVAIQKNSKAGFGLTRALNKLRSHQDAIKGPNDLLKIQYLGPKTAGNLTKKLKEHCLEEGAEMPEGFKTPVKRRDHDASSSQDTPVKKTKKVTKRKYIPAKRSGGYSILIALAVNDRSQVGMTKDEIVRRAAGYSDKSFSSNPSTNQFYSAWSSCKTLMNNNLVECFGRPIHYKLTEAGVELGRILAATEGIKLGQAEISNVLEVLVPQRNGEKLFNGTNYSIWKSHEYEVVVVMDNREIRSLSEREYFTDKLSQMGLKVFSRPLAVGDVIWIACNKVTGEELVLDYIVERKRLDDLVESIKSGRLNEQKIRLEKTGITNKFLVVEDTSSADAMGFGNAIDTTITYTIIKDKFYVERTKDHDDTAKFIYLMTKKIASTLASMPVIIIKPRDLKTQNDFSKLLSSFRQQFNDTCGMSFASFQTMLNKSQLTTVKEVYVKMLMTCKGISLEKALVIQKSYPTPKSLLEAYIGLADNEKAKKQLIRNTTASEVGSKSIGPKISERVYETWGKLTY